MKFADHLSKAQIQQFNQLRRFTSNQGEKPKPVHHEQLTRRDIEDLMGTRRDIYKRVGGAVRRR